MNPALANPRIAIALLAFALAPPCAYSQLGVTQPDPGRVSTVACQATCFSPGTQCADSSQCCDEDGDSYICTSSGLCGQLGDPGDSCGNDDDCSGNLACLSDPSGNKYCEPSGACDCGPNACAAPFVCSCNPAGVGAATCVSQMQGTDACPQTGTTLCSCTGGACPGTQVAGMSEEVAAYCTSGCDSGCATDDDCPGGLVCIDGECGCSNPCDDPSCSGYSEGDCGGGDGGCANENDCPGGLVCIGGTCGCGDPCDDPTCPGYSAGGCGGDGGGGSGGGGCDPGGCPDGDCSQDPDVQGATPAEIGNCPENATTPAKPIAANTPPAAKKETLHA